MESIRGGRARRQVAQTDAQEDAPNLQPLDEALEESGLTPSQFRKQYPHVGQYHADLDGGTAIDRRQIDWNAS